MSTGTKLALTLGLMLVLGVYLTAGAFAFDIIQLGDRVWLDANQNGIQDAGEVGVAGAKVELWYDNSAFTGSTTPDWQIWRYYSDATHYTLAQTTTNASGNYLFDSVYTQVPYVVVFYLPSGYQFTLDHQGGDIAADSDALTDWTGMPFAQPAAGAGHSTIFTPMVSDLTWDAGVILPVVKGAIGDRVWNDLNHDGIQNVDGSGNYTEAGVANVTVNLLDTAGNVLATDTTDSDGYYLFEGLDAGQYVVQFVLPSGYAFTLKNASGSTRANDSNADTTSGKTDVINLAQGQTDLDWDAGLYVPVAPKDVLSLVKTMTKVGGSCGTSITVGDTIKVTITVNANINTAAQTCSVSDVVDTSLTVLTIDSSGQYVSAQHAVVWSPVALPLGVSTTTLSFTAKIASLPKGDNGGSGTYVSNTVSLTITGTTLYCTTPPSGTLNNYAVLGPPVTPPPPPADTFKLVKSASKVCGSCGPGWSVGDTIKFTIKLTATVSAAQSGEIADIIDTCLTSVSVANGGQYRSSQHMVVWPVQLAAGTSTTTVSFTAKIGSLPKGNNGALSGSGYFTSNTTQNTVSGGYGGYAAANPGLMCNPTTGSLKNCATFGPPSALPPNTITVSKSGAKTGGAPGPNASQIWVGDTLTFTITVNANLTRSGTYTVTDDLDSCLKFTSADNNGTCSGSGWGGWYGGCSGGGTVNWTLNLPAGTSSKVVHLVVQVKSLPSGDNSMGGGTGAIVSQPVQMTIEDSCSHTRTLQNVAVVTSSGCDDDQHHGGCGW